MASNFIDLAPRGPLRADGQQWDVFLSYRSVSRPWVLKLYDTLTHLDYQVFMDQFVLTANAGLASQLERHLDGSATGVLIWSTLSEDSDWCRREYDAMINRESQQFRYVVANVDTTKPPAFARQKLYVDFSDLREGPSGTGLLRLLYGLHGKPLSPEAVALAAAYDDATRKGQARIAAAKETGDADALIELAASADLEWTTTPHLWCQAAEALIAIKRPADAVPLLQRAVAAFPRSIRPQQLLGLVHARQGDWRGAQRVLGELVELGERDPETLGLLARTWRDRYTEGGNLLHLRKARNLYAEAYAAAPNDYYTGINAATNSLLLGEADVAEQLAASVEKLVGAAAVPDNDWATATAAEVQLLRSRYAEAARLYQAAVDIAPEAQGSHDSMLQQAQRLMDALQAPPDERTRILKAFGRA